MSRNTRKTVLLALLVTVSVLAGSMPGTAAATTGSATFKDNIITETRGDTVQITVKHTDTATVYIGSRSSGFLLKVELEGSGTSSFTLDTYATTGKASEFHSAAGTATLLTPQLNQPIAPADYQMNVTVNGVERDIGRLTIEERGSMDADTTIAPEAIFDDDGSVTIEAAETDATDRQDVAVGDAAIFTIEEDGLENALNTDDLDGDGNANGIEIRLRELDPGPNADPETLIVTEDPGFTVLPDLENDRFLVIWDTERRSVEQHSNNTWQMEVVFTPKNGFVETETVVASSRVKLQPRIVATNGPDHRAFYPWQTPKVYIQGNTTLAPGTVLEVHARSVNPPFLRTSVVEVDPQGDINAALDISQSSSGQTVPVWVLGYREATERTVVRYDERASMAFHDQVSNSEVIRVDSVQLAAGGFVEVRALGHRYGVSEYLSPGTHEDLTIELDSPLPESTEVTLVARLDRNLDESFVGATDHAYRKNDSVEPVTVSARVELQGTGKTTTSTTTETPQAPNSSTTPVETPTTTVTTTATMTTTNQTTTHLAESGPLVERTPIPAIASSESSASVPFPAWSAVVAFAAVALLARRRGGESP